MKTIIATASLLLAGSLVAFAQYTNKSSVLDGSGTMASGGTFTNISAAGQPGGIAVATGGGYVNQAGFLNTFLLKPALDTDKDGIPNEADMDNDNDGLLDEAEMAGSSFIPVTVTDLNAADSDGDGIPDGAEAVAGTNPMDADAMLEIVRIARGGIADIAWVARSNKTYRVLYSATPMQPVTNVLGTVTASGFANAPWYVLTNTITDASGATNSRVYGIHVLP
jgi:hypothetical protein